MKQKLPFVLSPLDSRFVAAKPQHSIDPHTAETLEREGVLLKTRKRDGYRHFLAVTKQDVALYTRGIENVTELHPKIVSAAETLRIPYDTLLDGELLVDKDGTDDFTALTKIAKSRAEKARDLGNQTCIQFMVFDIILCDGVVTTSLPYEKRLEMLKAMIEGHEASARCIMPVHIIEKTFEEAKKDVHKHKWEGLVLYDRTASSSFHLDGKTQNPPRPNGIWKWKPRMEDDFIARRWAKGTGRNKNRVGKLFLSQIDPTTNQEVPCGEVGGGFSDEERETLANNALYPLVVQVEFQKKFESGALRHPVFIRVREDKTPQECIFKNE